MYEWIVLTTRNERKTKHYAAYRKRMNETSKHALHCWMFTLAVSYVDMMCAHECVVAGNEHRLHCCRFVVQSHHAASVSTQQYNACLYASPIPAHSFQHISIHGTVLAQNSPCIDYLWLSFSNCSKLEIHSFETVILFLMWMESLQSNFGSRPVSLLWKIVQFFSQIYDKINYNEVRLAYFKRWPAHHFSETHPHMPLSQSGTEQTPLIIQD